LQRTLNRVLVAHPQRDLPGRFDGEQRVAVSVGIQGGEDADATQVQPRVVGVLEQRGANQAVQDHRSRRGRQTGDGERTRLRANQVSTN
jgi:hypothetical protein